MPAGILRWLYDANQGQSWNGKPSCLTLSFDCDYPEDVTAIPSLLEILRPYPFRASFACVGYWIEKYPEVHGRILEDGHEIINHTYSHPDNEILNPGRKFRECTLSEKTEEVERCHTVCERILGYSPSGFRIPHFKHNFGPEIYGILQKLGYRISSSTWLTNTLTGGLPFRFGDIVEFPLATCPCHPFTVFDSWHSLHSRRWIHRIGHRGEKGFVDAFRRLLVIGKTRNAYLNVYIDPLDVPRISGFRGLLEEIARGDFEVVTYGQFLERFPSRVVVDKMK
ncbi:polysaccharide deacetylase family protein [Candidatus Poribacteria bacterium]|nr:polysaccharide deacetylase family protein [Candidatus Poribacteria bacterium]